MPLFHLRWLAILPLLLTVSCTDTASREDCEQACKHQQQLQQAAGPAGRDGGPAEGSAGLKLRLDALGKELAGELSRLEAEQQGLQDKAASDEERARIKDDYDSRVDAKQKEYESKFEELREQIDEADDVAKEPPSEKEETAGLETARAVSDCADRCLELETGKDKIACRMRATNLEQFKACR